MLRWVGNACKTFSHNSFLQRLLFPFVRIFIGYVDVDAKMRNVYSYLPCFFCVSLDFFLFRRGFTRNFARKVTPIFNFCFRLTPRRVFLYVPLKDLVRLILGFGLFLPSQKSFVNPSGTQSGFVGPVSPYPRFCSRQAFIIKILIISMSVNKKNIGP